MGFNGMLRNINKGSYSLLLLYCGLWKGHEICNIAGMQSSAGIPQSSLLMMTELRTQKYAEWVGGFINDEKDRCER